MINIIFVIFGFVRVGPSKRRGDSVFVFLKKKRRLEIKVVTFTNIYTASLGRALTLDYSPYKLT